MSKVLIQQLKIKNFKGIEDLVIDFSNVTSISANNGLGKTSIFDAFTWLLFDKDSKNRSTFDIKPLDENNQVIKGLNPTVEGLFDCDGQVIRFKKTYKEKWAKKRMETKARFAGNETLYEVNDVPFKKKDYVAKVNEIVGEEKFKLLSNPYYFSDALNWKDARKVVLDIAGDLDIEDVIKAEPRLEEIRQPLADFGDVDMLMASKKAAMSKLSKEKNEIPVRISEIKNNYLEVNEQELQMQKMSKEIELAEIKGKIDLKLEEINHSVEAEQKTRDKIREKQNLQDKIREEAIKEFLEKKQFLISKRDKIEETIYEVQQLEKRNSSLLSTKKEEIRFLENEINNLKNQYRSVYSETPGLDSVDTVCPTCKRPFEITDIKESQEELIKNFNLAKAKRLENINERGKLKTKQVSDYQSEIDVLVSESEKNKAMLEELSNKSKEVEKSLENLKETDVYSQDEKERIKALDIDIEGLKLKLNNSPAVGMDELYEEKRIKESEINEIISELRKVDTNKQLDERIEKLSQDEKEIGIKLVEMEKQVMLCELFVITRINLLEDSINSRFKNVSFKMFKELVNGELSETCEALIDGVPFSMANTASQINAGLDIINTLSEYYDISVPVFIDNAECINQIIDTKGQLIRLIVSKDKNIVVEGK